MDARTTAGCTVKYDCNPTCPSRKPFKKRPTRRGGIHAARAPCPHHQLSPICCAVGAGHARPFTLPLLRFNLPYCREGGLDPPPHIAFIAPYSRQVAYVGAAYMPPAPPSHRNPLYLSPPTTPIYTLPKNRSQNLSKNPKKLLTRVILLAIIIKLSRGGHAAKSAS